MKRVGSGNFLAICATALFSSAGNVSAGDWDGSYFGVVISRDDGTSNHINGTAETLAPDISGKGYGLTFGHNFPTASGNLLLGIELDAMSSDLYGDTPDGVVNTYGCGNLGGCRTKVSWLASLRGRLGYIQGNTLFYGTAGLAAGGVEGSIAGFGTLTNGIRRATGWTVGVGIEHLLGDRLSLKGEVLYTDLGKTRYDRLVDDDAYYVDVTVTQVRVGLNYQF